MLLFSLTAIVVSTWLALALAGVPVLLHLTERQQQLILPGLPVVGAMSLVVLVHWPAAVLPTPISLGLSAVVLLGFGVIGWRRGGRVHLSLRKFGPLALALILGVVPMVLALLPTSQLDRPRLVQPTFNNDAFAYVSVSSWLRENPSLDIPKPVEDAPVYGYVGRHLDIGLRIGEEFLQVGGALINGRDVASTWYVVLATWILVLPGAMWAACRLTGLSSPLGAAAAFVAGTSAVLLSQVYNQNSAAVLGIAIAPLAIAALVRRLDGDDILPRWAAPLALTALAGTYTEYLPVLLPGLAVFAGVRHPRNYPVVGGRGIVALAAALVVSPFVWFNVGRSLLLEKGLTAPGVESSFIHAPGLTILDRVVGATWLDGFSESSVGRWLSLLLALGLVGALSDRRLRRMWLPILGGAVAAIGYLTFVHAFPYGQQRAVQIMVPLALLVATVGFGEFVRLARRVVPSGRSALRGVLSAPLVLAGVMFPVVNISSSVRWERQFQVAARTVDASFLEGVGWIKDFDHADGAETLLVDSNFFEQLWLTYELRHEERLAYPFLYPDYMNVGRYDRWDGRLRRFVLVGRDDYIDVDPGVVVRENARFLLLDLAQGDAVIATPSVNWGGGERRPEGVGHWMVNAGEVLVIRTPGAPTSLLIEGNALPDLDPLPLNIVTAEAELVASGSIGAESTLLRATLPDRPAVLLFFNNGKQAQRPSSGGDAGDRSYYLTRVARE